MCWKSFWIAILVVVIGLAVWSIVSMQFVGTPWFVLTAWIAIHALRNP